MPGFRFLRGGRRCRCYWMNLGCSTRLCASRLWLAARVPLSKWRRTEYTGARLLSRSTLKSILMIKFCCLCFLNSKITIGLIFGHNNIDCYENNDKNWNSPKRHIGSRRQPKFQTDLAEPCVPLFEIITWNNLALQTCVISKLALAQVFKCHMSAASDSRVPDVALYSSKF